MSDHTADDLIEFLQTGIIFHNETAGCPVHDSIIGNDLGLLFRGQIDEQIPVSDLNETVLQRSPVRLDEGTDGIAAFADIPVILQLPVIQILSIPDDLRTESGIVALSNPEDTVLIEEYMDLALSVIQVDTVLPVVERKSFSEILLLLPVIIEIISSRRVPRPGPGEGSDDTYVSDHD